MPGGHPHYHRGFSHADRPEPMPKDDLCHAEPAARRPFELLQSRDRERSMSFVLEGGDAAPGRAVRPNPPDEDDDPPELVSPEGAHRSGHGKRHPGQSNGHGQPPPYGGCTANSSPGRTRVA